MLEAERARVERLSRKGRDRLADLVGKREPLGLPLARRPVNRVAEPRAAAPGEVHPDLVRPARVKRELEPRREGLRAGALARARARVLLEPLVEREGEPPA